MSVVAAGVGGYMAHAFDGLLNAAGGLVLAGCSPVVAFLPEWERSVAAERALLQTQFYDTGAEVDRIEQEEAAVEEEEEEGE